MYACVYVCKLGVSMFWEKISMFLLETNKKRENQVLDLINKGEYIYKSKKQNIIILKEKEMNDVSSETVFEMSKQNIPVVHCFWPIVLF